MKPYLPSEVQELAERALDAACLLIQDELGVKSGDVAAHFFSGSDDKEILLILRRYIQSEINVANWPI